MGLADAEFDLADIRAGAVMSRLKHLHLKRMSNGEYYWSCQVCSADGYGFSATDATEIFREHRRQHSGLGVHNVLRKRI